jgi:lipid A disaccharide synthetase
MKYLKQLLNNFAALFFGIGGSEKEYQRVKTLLDEHKLNAMKYSMGIC